MPTRFERRPRAGVTLTERDLRTVTAVFEARYLTNRQVGRLFYRAEDSSSCRQRLRYLYDLDYLRKRAAGPNDPDIYFLGLEGRRYISTLGTWSRERVDKIAGVSGESVAAPALMMEHELTLAGLYVSARLQGQEIGWEMQWKNARMLELETLDMQPDAWIGVQRGEQQQEAFIEFTAAMPNAAELAGKLARYQGFWERTQRPIAVLWFTTSQQKAERLLQGIRPSLYQDFFLVGLIEDAAHFLTRKMWRWGASSTHEAQGMVQWLCPPTGR
jgi:hypothetical protein